MIVIEGKCKDYGRPGCLEEPDERYTMRFDDIGEPPILWCAMCGAEAAAVNEVLIDALKNPDFRKKFEAALDSVEAKKS